MYCTYNKAQRRGRRPSLVPYIKCAERGVGAREKGPVAATHIQFRATRRPQLYLCCGAATSTPQASGIRAAIFLGSFSGARHGGAEL